MPEVGKPIGVGAGKFCGVQRIFVQISPNLPEKTPMQMTSKKKSRNDWISFYFGRFFQMKALQTPFLPKFPLTCPTNTKKIMMSKIKKRKRLHFHFGHHLCKIKAHKTILRRLSHILPDLPQIFHGFLRYFTRIFTKSKFSGLRLHSLHPRLLHHWPNLLYVWAAYRKTQVTKSRNKKIWKPPIYLESTLLWYHNSFWNDSILFVRIM